MAVKALLSALVIVLSLSVWVIGMWIVFCLALVFLVKPPKHLIWRRVFQWLLVWLGAFALYRILYLTDFWGGRSLVENGRLACRRWIITKRAESRMFRMLLGFLSVCVLLRILVDIFHLARP